MAITVQILNNGVLEPIEVPEGVTIDFTHPGSPLRVLSKDDTALLVVHPHQWVFATRNIKTPISDLQSMYYDLNGAICSGEYPGEQDELLAAQQAIAWALNPEAAMNPYDMIMKKKGLSLKGCDPIAVGVNLT